jgi:geranylgeranyl diphosphate synthase type II
MVQGPTSTFESYAVEMRTRIDAAMDEYTQYDAGCPDRLREAIRYSLLAPGKRLRPTLVLLAAEACQAPRDAAMPAACAVEMIHTYSLIHDDLPAMDDDDMRRGKPTCHKVFGDGLAILAGDALLAQAFEVLARDIRPPAVAAACCAVLGHAAGAAQLVGGQADDLGNEFLDGGLETLESIHARKTGAMFLASLRLGALVAQADLVTQRMLEFYGTRLGLAFQITDDLLDVRGDATAVGKRVGKDCDRGKLTFPSLLGVNESVRRAETLIEEACAALEPLAPHASGLDALARYVLERNH